MFTRLRTTSERAIASTLTIALTLGVSVVLGAGPASAADPDLRFGVTGTIPLGTDVSLLVQDASSHTLFSGDPDAATITVVDTETSAVRSTYRAPGGLNSLAVSESDSLLFVADTRAGTVSALDSASGEIVFTSAVSAPTSLVVDDALEMLWVYSEASGTLQALDSVDGHAIGDSVTVGKNVGGFSVDVSAQTLFVAVEWSPELIVIDENTQQVIRRVPFTSSLFSVVVDPETHVAYAGRTGSVSRIDPDPAVPVTDFATELSVDQLVLDPGSNQVFVMDDYDGTLGAMDRTTGAVLLHGSVPLFSRILLDGSGQRIYMRGSNYRSISILTKGVPASIRSTDLGGTLQHTVPFTSPALVAEGPGPITWSIVQGSYYGLTIGKESGVVSGTPQYQATYKFTVRAGNTFGFDDLPITTEVIEQPATLPAVGHYKFFIPGVKGQPISGRVDGSTGYPAPTLAAIGLPKGVTMDSRGNIDGYPKERGLFNVRVTAKNSSGSTTKVLPLRVLGQGSYTADIDFGYSRTTLNQDNRKQLRALARSIHKNSTMTDYHVLGLAPNTKHKWKDLKRAKARAWAIAKYLRKQGVSAKPTYLYRVEKDYSKYHSYGWSATSVYYTYK